MYRYKEEFTRRSDTFTIVVSRHEEKEYDDNVTGPNRWCVYAYLYPKHPLYDKLNGTVLLNQIPSEIMKILPFHGGISYFSVHWNSSGDDITSYQLGADYNHLGDNRFTYYLSPDEAVSVFNDANRLFDVLLNYKPQ